MPRGGGALLGIAAVLCAALAVGIIASTPAAPAGDVVVTVNATSASGTIAARLGTQFVWPGSLDHATGTRERFGSLAPPLVRINATPLGTHPVLPAGMRQGDWNFENLDSMVNDIRRGGGSVVLTVAFPPGWIWTCRAGATGDRTFGTFGDYMARLVAYYNHGSFVAENGRTITNAAGVANRIEHWELWNEPDQFKGCEADGSNHLSPSDYVLMWNGTVPKMLAVDPTIKLIGPAVAHAITKNAPDYIPALLAGAVRKPDAISFHGYGGWLNSQTDRFLFDGEGSGFGLEGIERGLKRVKALAPETPMWITELNVNSAWDREEAGRAWKQFGAAWGASAFRRLALAGADIVLQYQFAHPDQRQFSLVDARTGEPLLPYWRDYHLARYFPPGSTVISSGSNLAGVESLAARPPGSNDIHLLVVNRQVDAALGGHGRSATVHFDLRNLPGPSAVTALVLDATTPLDTGPPAVVLSTEGPLSLTFAGYSVAFLRIVPAI